MTTYMLGLADATEANHQKILHDTVYTAYEAAADAGVNIARQYETQGRTVLVTVQHWEGEVCTHYQMLNLYTMTFNPPEANPAHQ